MISFQSHKNEREVDCFAYPVSVRALHQGPFYGIFL